ncbi:class A beta-lactamase-related serine hydrolase [Bacteriovoracaceae bacterium]|nr:class A beta-lactamase-related serine hydrolase [Bacteriovoracaceae bacterium]
MRIAIIISLLQINFSFAQQDVELTPGQPEFFHTMDGKDIDKVQVRKQKLGYVFGTGLKPSKYSYGQYRRIKNLTKKIPNFPMQWTLAEINQNRILSHSKNHQLKFFGASVSKIFVAGAFLFYNKGKVSNRDLTELGKMISVSDNVSWKGIQRKIGSGDDNVGRRLIHAFTQALGYKRTVAFQGWLDDFHGNELTAFETTQFIMDTFHQKYEGASTLWKVMFTTLTGKERGKKYLPNWLYVGGKTGTYRGTTVDPETGAEKYPNGNPYRVNVRHHALIFSCAGQHFALTILNNYRHQEYVSILSWGLFKEYVEPLCRKK